LTIAERKARLELRDKLASKESDEATLSEGLRLLLADPTVASWMFTIYRDSGDAARAVTGLVNHALDPDKLFIKQEDIKIRVFAPHSDSQICAIDGSPPCGEPPPIEVKNLHRSGRPTDRIRGTCGSTHRFAPRGCEGMASVHVKLEIVCQRDIPVDKYLVGRRTGHLVIEPVSFTGRRHRSTENNFGFPLLERN